MGDEGSKDKKDHSIEVIIVGLLVAIVLLTGTPVFGRSFSGMDQGQEVRAVPVLAEH